MPINPIVALGDSIKFYCLSTGKIRWTLNDEPLPHNIEIEKTRNYIMINKVTLGHSGTFQCTSVDYPFLKTSDTNLTVVGKLTMLNYDNCGEIVDNSKKTSNQQVQ